jgi:hypothetical protein
MNRDAKTISSSCRPEIERVKSYILDAVRPFDGDGYIFRTALSELRKEGVKIAYIKNKCHYIKL